MPSRRQERPPLEIHELRDADWPAVWGILEPVFAAGETYAFATDVTEDQARRAWVDVPTATYVAVAAGQICGTYYLKPSHEGPGDHVCNCGYVVADSARGRGVAATMCEHSQREAFARGFRAMQFNLVVSTNEGAVRLWKRLGYSIVGTLPLAFRHPRDGYVDAYVLHKALVR